jgi:16S rRNA (guanine527-N7)-methyltransferase
VPERRFDEGSELTPNVAVDSSVPQIPAELMPAVTAVFGVRIGLASTFAHELAGSAVERGLIGPREVPRLWERHLLNCAAVADLVPEGSSVGDVGSGAGLPGLVLAIVRPDLRVTLIEPLQRRVIWLAEVVDRLELRGLVTVLRSRAEDSPQRDFDVVTARAVASLDVLAGWCLPLVRSGGVMLALKGQSAADELARAEPTLRRSGACQWDVRRCGEGVLPVPTTVIRVLAGTRPVGRRR